MGHITGVTGHAARTLSPGARCSLPASAFSSVVLPAPGGPSSSVNRPCTPVQRQIRLPASLGRYQWYTLLKGCSHGSICTGLRFYGSGFRLKPSIKGNSLRCKGRLGDVAVLGLSSQWRTEIHQVRQWLGLWDCEWHPQKQHKRCKKKRRLTPTP